MYHILQTLVKHIIKGIIMRFTTGFQNYFIELGEHQSLSNHIEIEETTTIRCGAPTVGC